MENGRPKSHTGDYNIKRRFGKGFRNSKKSMMIFSSNRKNELDTDYDDSVGGTPHRSCSLNALHTGQVLLQPRMAQLETLEAKMARIENSLSTTPRKKKISSSNNSISSALVTSNTNLSLNGQHQENQSPLYDTKSLKSISTSPKVSPGPNGALIYRTSKDIFREMDALKNALRDKENVIDSLKGQLNTSINVNRLSTTYLQSKHKNDHICNDKQVAEDQLQRLKHEVENKSLLIKNIKLELERLDITDNIDIRIQQAELEYQLGREELNLLSLLEEIQNFKIIIDDQDIANHINENNLFGYVHKKHSTTLHATEIMYNPKSPRFGATFHEDKNALTVDWSTEDSGLLKGDVLIEINGKLTLGLCNRDDVIRLISVSPSPAQIVIMRQHNKSDVLVSSLKEELNAYREKAGEAERIRDSFRSDNVRLTHRISYLEEQVAELLNRVSKTEPLSLSRPSEKHSTDSPVQIFQKGSKVTVIGNMTPNKNNLKIQDSLPTISQTLRNKTPCKSMDALSQKDDTCRMSELICSLPVNNCNRNDSITQLNLMQPELHNRSLGYMNYQSPSNCKNKENFCSVNERRLRYIKDAQNFLLNGSGERHNRHFKDDRSAKSVDFDSEPNYQSMKHSINNKFTMYDSETSSDYSKTIKYPRPIPPQKPLRLSLHKGCSLQSVKFIDKSNTKEAMTRQPNQASNYEPTVDKSKTDKRC